MGAPTPLPLQPDNSSRRKRRLPPVRPPPPARRRRVLPAARARRRCPHDDGFDPDAGNGLGTAKPQPQRCILDMFPYPSPRTRFGSIGRINYSWEALKVCSGRKEAVICQITVL
ncbi:hypothetical protein VPH35_018662 [Triticum aestivum]|uniref:Uncharacterized protein n=1 Tax=Triticum urartu TaxID=4572 RepID=A0A8R7TCK2_TRIUA